ncbi:MAG: hypothetical protein ABI473_14065 [Candidatus Dormibacter sp.]
MLQPSPPESIRRIEKVPRQFPRNPGRTTHSPTVMQSNNGRFSDSKSASQDQALACFGEREVARVLKYDRLVSRTRGHHPRRSLREAWGPASVVEDGAELDAPVELASQRLDHSEQSK